jgi:hypothetical protein
MEVDPDFSSGENWTARPEVFFYGGTRPREIAVVCEIENQ